MKYWGRLLGRNTDRKNSEEFSSLIFQSHLYSFALRFLFLHTHATSYSFFSALLYTVKEENLIENHNPFPMVEEIHTETSSLNTLNIMLRNLKESVRSWIRLLVVWLLLREPIKQRSLVTDTHTVYILCIRRVNGPRLMLLVYGVHCAVWVLVGGGGVGGGGGVLQAHFSRISWQGISHCCRLHSCPGTWHWTAIRTSLF